MYCTAFDLLVTNCVILCTSKTKKNVDFDMKAASQCLPVWYFTTVTIRHKNGGAIRNKAMTGAKRTLQSETIESTDKIKD